jgi:hypothetical protein
MRGKATRGNSSNFIDAVSKQSEATEPFQGVPSPILKMPGALDVIEVLQHVYYI